MNVKVISSEEEARNLFQTLNSDTPTVFFVIPVFSDPKAHLAFNTLSVLFVIGDNDLYVLGFNHNETPNLPISILNGISPQKKILTPSKRDLMYVLKNVPQKLIVDVLAEEYHLHGKVPALEEFYPKMVVESQQRFRVFQNINRSVPLMKLVEYIQNFLEYIPRNIDFMKCFSLLEVYCPEVQEIIIPTLQYIEKNGLFVNKEKLEKFFGEKSLNLVKNGFLYSQYHPLTSTGRPSNSFGGINFGALNKHDGSRSAFVSRYEGGRLILFDFESFHLRLMADLVGIPQPSEPFHEYLAKIYLGVQQVTQNQYDEGKQRTFSYLYGERRPESPIAFFDNIYKWQEDFWKEAQFKGNFTTRLGRTIRLEDVETPSKEKIFNYYMQSLEAYESIKTIQECIPIFDKTNIKPILYIYDSILLDVDGGHEEEIHSIREILSQKFPVRQYEGKDFHRMELIS